jgi:hypothetical protein
MSDHGNINAHTQEFVSDFSGVYNRNSWERQNDIPSQALAGTDRKGQWLDNVGVPWHWNPNS